MPEIRLLHRGRDSVELRQYAEAAPLPVGPVLYPPMRRDDGTDGTMGVHEGDGWVRVYGQGLHYPYRLNGKRHG